MFEDRDFKRDFGPVRAVGVSSTESRASESGPWSGLANKVEEAHDRLTCEKNRFIEHNLKRVVAIAKGDRNLGFSFPDLIQEGNLGLIRALKKLRETAPARSLHPILEP